MSSRENMQMFAICAAGNFLSATIYSLQAPFFPAEAEKKQVTPMQYGLVFSIYELAMITVLPVLGSYINRIGLKLCLCGGLFIAGYCCILFGCLTMIQDSTTFLIYALIIRIFEAVGQAFYAVSSFTLVTSAYSATASEKLGNMCAAFAGGMIVGPAVGGVLYSLGGFALPFLVIGCNLAICLCFAICLVPRRKPETEEGQDKAVIKILLKEPMTWLGIYCIFACAFCSGFLLSTLEPHLRVFHLSPSIVGLFFVITSFVYAVTNVVPGRLIDKGMDPMKIMIIGAALKVVAFSLIGPLPWLPLKPQIYLVVLGLVINGLGSSAEYIPGFGQLLEASKFCNSYTNPDTHAAISALYQSAMSLGLLAGPSLGGVAIQYFDFPEGTLMVIGVNVVLILLCLGFCVLKQRNLVTVNTIS